MVDGIAFVMVVLYCGLYVFCVLCCKVVKCFKVCDKRLTGYIHIEIS